MRAWRSHPAGSADAHPPAGRDDASRRRRAAQLAWLANVALGTLLGASFLAHVPDLAPLKAWIFGPIALLSSIVTLTLVPGLACVLAAQLLPLRAGAWLQAAIWSAFQMLLYADTRIYNMFRYHFSGQVWDLVYTRGVEDAVHLGWEVLAAIALGLALGILLQHWIWRRAWSGAGSASRRSALAARLLRPGLAWGFLLLPAVVLDKTIYAEAAWSRDRQVTQLARLFPFYPRLPLEELASRVLLLDEPTGAGIEHLDLNLEGERLRYPIAMPAIAAGEPRATAPDGGLPDILIVAIDCWRRDMLTPEHSPGMARLAERCRRFEDHLSAGNSTRFGVFGMLYGLPGSYWFPALAERRGPVLIDALVAAGYECGVFSAASMDYPELRATAWQGIAEHVRDEWGPEPAWRRDELAAEALLEWRAELAGSAAVERRPSFAFLLLDSPHQTYSYPPGDAPFQPAAESLDYLALTATLELAPAVRQSVYNRYRNSVRHADRVASELVGALEARGLLDSTIVVVTGDHGEEFWESGAFGHTSNFSDAQLRVPLLMRGPGIEPGEERRPTSHLDLPCTLLELLGADPGARGLWSLGLDLLDPPERRMRLVSGWKELGLHCGDVVLRLPLHDRGSFDVDTWTPSWQPVLADAELLAANAEELEGAGWACRRFLR
jgi:membrane-anchored protein YejM (alkaline phosphatase superfamily)